jgi:KDO2-lipid IV(A) lauroyltransferase
MKALRYRLEYAFTLLMAWVLQHLSLDHAQGLGRAMGKLAYYLGLARGTTHANLRRYLGLEKNADRRRIALEAYRNFGQTLVEVARMPVTDPADLEAWFDFQGLEILEEARAAGKGIVCLSAHYGNWEWMGAALIRRGFPVTFLIGTQSNPYVDRLFNDYRARVGIQFVRIRSIKDALRVLKQNGLVALLDDQDGDKWGSFAPFFGEDASTHTIGTLLARKAGSALCFGVPERLGARSFRMQVQRLAPEPAGLSDAQATAFLLNEYNQRLEKAVRAQPGQWLWMHNRWRSKPVHRLAGEERARAERGELSFDWKESAWRDAKSGELVALETWK